MAKERAGYERRLKRGTAGSTATTLVDVLVTDLDIEKTKERASTTDRGDGTSIPRTNQQVVARNCQISWKMNYKDTDAHIAAFLAVADSGGAIALLVERISGGDVEFDGDCTIDYSSPGPLADGMVLEFTAFPTKEAGRDWSDT